ncbi:HAMP domain-containing histidine kinase [Paenibacillus sp. P96]|uniref:histidine kinase n=1 Tax=Paenibacillus zeirhizosphaerae TaxID=2987519 RepID=A0ABT9FNL1_9BACL|nr:HAMP domain-containing sensor histidine kinase [Paenibacillus sp. P96]MDP4096317.1 HAMP domain-containing histidine kinase [Paenibacillus sp. P96]
MKLWQKIFLCTLVLFACVFNAASLYLIEHHFSQNLKKEIESGLTEQLIVQSGLQTNGAYLNQKLGFPQSVLRDFLRVAFAEYTQNFGSKGVFIEILDEHNGIVYSSFKEELEGARKELQTPLSGQRHYIIRDIGSKSYLFVISRLELEDDTFKLVYIRDISDVYTNKAEQYSLFIKLNIITTVSLAAALYLLLWYLTRSIRGLSNSVQTIARGDYTQRIEVASKDEVGSLARSFNQMAAAVEENVEELKTAAEHKQRFIEALTHELKTPLTSIIGYADFLRSTRYDEEVFFNGLHFIYVEGKRLESLSFKLMDMILLSKNELKGRNEDIQAVCGEIAESLKPRLNDCSMELVLQVEADTVLMDKDLFKVLCINLLDNAIKASPADSRIYLRGQAVQADHTYVLEIEDEGIGIPEGDISKVFEPFYMVDQAETRSRHGAGLGLAICAEIIKLHKAQIEIFSVVNQGTRVKMTFTKEYN